MKGLLGVICFTMLCFFVAIAIAADKVIVVPLNTSAGTTEKLWGKGRPGTSLRTHLGTNGYCTTNAGVNFALSYNYASWHNAADVCPSGKWVCRFSDLLAFGSCNIQQVDTWPYVLCDGTLGTYGNQTSMAGYVSDAYSLDPTYGHVLASDDLSYPSAGHACYERPIWCCWN